MTPTLQQAIKLLQMTRLELQDVVNQELVSNPVLEEQDPESTAAPDEDSGAAETRERELAETPGSGAESVDALSDDGDGGSEPLAALPDAPVPEPVVDPAPSETMEDALSDIDLEAYFGDYMDGTATAPRMSEQAEVSRSKTGPMRRPASSRTSPSSSASRMRRRTSGTPAGS